MAGCNDDIILRKDNVICDKGSGISLKDFILKVLEDEGISGSTGGGTSGGSSTTSLFVSASDQSGTAGEITLPNSGQPLIIRSTRADINITRSGNQIIIGNPPAACAPVVSPTIASFTLDVAQLEIGVSKNSFIPTFTTTALPGSATTTPGVEPNCTTANSAWTSFQIVAALSSGNQTFTSVVSGTTKTLSSALIFTAPGQTCVFTLTGTGTKSDSTSHTATATATISARFKVFTGYVRTTTSPGAITTSSLTGSALVSSIAGPYGGSGHPGTGECYFYFAIPAALNITTATLGVLGFSFLSTSDAGNGYTGTDTYNGTDTTYIKTITNNGINYSLYRSNNATLAAFGNITIT